MTGTPPKVFVSYSHDSVEHQDRVLGFADRLRADGIDAEVDQYNTSPPEGWPLWCERQIAAADVVLMVCTETYNRRVRGDEERGEGLGVIWEARIIRQLLYDAGAVSNKFVPVLFSDTSPEQIPTPIKGGNWYVVDTAHGYDELYRRLTRQPSLLRPPIGAIRPLPARRRQWSEVQSEATTAPAPSSSAARSPDDATVAAGGDRSVAIGGNMISSAAVFGDHNVTHINTASDYYATQRHSLQIFSQSAHGKTIIQQQQQQLYAWLNKKRKIRTKNSLVLCAVFLLISLMEGWSTGSIYTLMVLYMTISAGFFLRALRSRKWGNLDVYPAIILEKRDITTVSSGMGHHEHIITIEKTDGSRRALNAGNYGHAIPGEIGVAVVNGSELFSFKRSYENAHKVTDATPAASPWKKIGYGVAVIVLDIFITLAGFRSPHEPLLWWESIFGLVVLGVAVYAIFLIVYGIVGGVYQAISQYERKKQVANQRAEDTPSSPPTG